MKDKLLASIDAIESAVNSFNCAIAGGYAKHKDKIMLFSVLAIIACGESVIDVVLSLASL